MYATRDKYLLDFHFTGRRALRQAGTVIAFTIDSTENAQLK